MISSPAAAAKLRSRKLGEDRLRHLYRNLGEGRRRRADGGGAPSMLPNGFVFAISPNAVRIMFPYFLDNLASFGNFLEFRAVPHSVWVLGVRAATQE
jgi:hypothetical protein